MADTLCLERSAEFFSRAELVYIASGQEVISQGQPGCDFFVLARGLVHTQIFDTDNNVHRRLFTVLPGQLMGQLSILSDIPSHFTFTAMEDSFVLRFKRADLIRVVDRFPRVMNSIIQQLLQNISPLCRQVDFAIEWTHVDAGRAIYRQGDVSSNFYIVLNGRLRSVVQNSGGHKELICEYGRLEIVGETEVLTGCERASTVLAVRDSEIAKFPASLFHIITKQFPQVMGHLMLSMGKRVMGMKFNKVSDSLQMHAHDTARNFSTIALIAVSEDTPLTAFATQLTQSLTELGPALHLNRSNIKKLTGYQTENLRANEEYQLIGWLGNQEETHNIVVYEADFAVTPWLE